MNTKAQNKSLSQKSEKISLTDTDLIKPNNMDNILISENNNENPKYSLNENSKNILIKINHSHISKMINIERYAFRKFNNFYSNEEDFYNIKVINEIICNESTHIVAVFKDYLINGDTSEFLQKLYSLKESKECLPKIFEYYDSCSVIFPNYVILPESQYIYKNIQRKQRVIDNQQDLEDKQDKIKKGLIKIKEDDDPVFNSVELDSILDQTDTSGIRRFFGIKNTESNLESKNISVENIIKKISTAENYTNEIKDKNEKSKMNINFITINSSKIKGRNYNRNIDSGYINSNNSKKKNNIGVNSISSISKNTKVSSTTIDLEPKNQNNIFYNSSNTIYVSNSLRNNNTLSKNNNNNISNNNQGIKKQNLINNLLANKNKEVIIKAFEELNKNKPNHFNSTTVNTSHMKKKIKNNNKNMLPPTDNKNNNNNKLQFNKISSSTNHMKTLSSSSSSPRQGLINNYHNKNTLSMSKLTISPNSQNVNQKSILNNKSGDKKKENLIRTLNIRENIPFTSRENLSPEYMSILNSKIKKIKNFNKKISSIPSKKKFIQNSSYNHNINKKQKDFHTINNETERNRQINYRNRKFNINLTENLSIPLNSKYMNQGNSKSHKNNSSKSPNISPEKKIMRTYAHFHSKSSFIGSNIDDKKKIKKIRNSVFPKQEINFKGFQIKGFKELLQNTHNNYNSRNSKGSSSERIFFENNTNKNIRHSNFSSKTFMDTYATIHKK